MPSNDLIEAAKTTGISVDQAVKLLNNLRNLSWQLVERAENAAAIPMFEMTPSLVEAFPDWVGLTRGEWYEKRLLTCFEAVCDELISEAQSAEKDEPLSTQLKTHEQAVDEFLSNLREKMIAAEGRLTCNKDIGHDSVDNLKTGFREHFKDGGFKITIEAEPDPMARQRAIAQVDGDLQPISTAPTDGTLIWGTNNRGQTDFAPLRKMYWGVGKPHSVDADPETSISDYVVNEGRPWWLNEDGFKMAPTPTHWKPVNTSEIKT